MMLPVAYAGKKIRGDFKVMAGLVGGPGAEPTGRRRIFENLQKISYENCKKRIILAYFSINLTNLALIFRVFRQKTQIVRKC